MDQGALLTFSLGDGNGGSIGMVQTYNGTFRSSNKANDFWIPYELKIHCTTMIFRNNVTGPECNNFEICIKTRKVSSGCVKCYDRQYVATFYLANPELTPDVPLKSAPNCTTYYF